MKTCNKCKQSLPESEFYVCKRNSDGLQGNCKDCCKQINNIRRATYPEKVKEEVKRYQASKHNRRFSSTGAIIESYSKKEERIAAIKALLAEYPNISTREMAEILQIGERYVRALLDTMNEP